MSSLFQIYAKWFTMIIYHRYYQYDCGGGDGDEICGDSRFFVF